MVGERTVLKNPAFMHVSKLPEVSGNLPEVSGNFPEVSGNFPEVSRNVQQFPKVSGSFLPASRVHRAGCTEGEGGDRDQVPTAQHVPILQLQVHVVAELLQGVLPVAGGALLVEVFLFCF